MADIEVGVLGPVRVVGSGGPADLPGGRQRGVVALLAMRPGEVTAGPRLIDALWGQDPPRTAVKTLHSHVARVRQALAACGLPGRLTTHDGGYALAVRPGAVDACRFEEYARAGRAQLARAELDAAVASLRAGLALWRGEPAEGVELAGWGAAEVDRLREARLAAAADLWDAELRRGNHELAAGELDRLLVAHPTRERLVGLLMLARYRGGRHTTALDAYQRLRGALADELGVDPGPELQALYAAVLRHDPTLSAGAEPATDEPAPRPAQLPAPVGWFTGRAGELAMLDQVRAAGETRVAVISGAAGMGKTALAVQWAHRAREHFPDGQLFLDLRGQDRPSTVSAAAALARLLRGLGVAADRMPADTAERAALYRSLLHDKRVLAVLDNAGEVSDVLPMVPAGTSSMLVVTSRARLTGLATHHAVRPVGLDVLHPTEAVALLRQALGADRAAREPDAVDRLAELCDRMPLALRIAAARLAGRPRQRIADLVAELADEGRLDALAVAGDARSVRAVFASAYQALTPPAAHAFRVLSLLPGGTVSGHLAAGVVGRRPSAVRPAIEELVAAHLLVEAGPDRYRYHDLIQLFAYERAGAEETAAGRAAATGRMVDWYVTVAGAANRLVDPGRDRVTVPAAGDPAELPFPPDRQRALAFLDDERDNLVPVVRYAAEHDRPAAAWRLTYLLTGFFDSRGHWQERVAMCHWGLTAARAEGDPAVEGLMRSGLGVSCIMTRRFEEALTHLDHALALMRQGGDRRGEGHACNNIAVALSNLRRFDEAVRAYRDALAVHEASGHELGKAVTLVNMGEACVRMGDVDSGLAHLRSALALSVRLGDTRLEAHARNGLGLGSLAEGAHREALDQLRQALALRRAAGDRRYAAETWNDLGMAHLRDGDPLPAASCFREALALSREIADQHVAAVAHYRLGLAQLAAGAPAPARRAFERALTLRRQVPDPYEQAHLHRGLGDLASAEGDPATADRHWDLAIDLYRKANAFAEADALGRATATAGALANPAAHAAAGVSSTTGSSPRTPAV